MFFFFSFEIIVVYEINTIWYFSTNNFNDFTECPSELYNFSEKKSLILISVFIYITKTVCWSIEETKGCEII